jgi:hypothetical protein
VPARPPASWGRDGTYARNLGRPGGPRTEWGHDGSAKVNRWTAHPAALPFPSGPKQLADYLAHVAVPDLIHELRSHLAEPFPDSVEKGEDYGEVDAVMIGADIYGWALGVSRGGSLSALDRSRFQMPPTSWNDRSQRFPVTPGRTTSGFS